MPLFLLLNLEPATLILYVYIISMCMWPYFSLFLQHFIYLKSNWNIHTKKWFVPGERKKRADISVNTSQSITNIIFHM